MARRSTIKGAASYRRFLRRLPDASTNQLRVLLTSAAPELAGYMRSLFPTRTGRGQASISYRGPTKALNLKIGQVDKKKASDAFYIHILDVGRKAGSKMTRDGLRRWGPLTGIFAISKTKAHFRSRWLPDYRDVTNKMLAEASQGAGDD